MPAVVDTRARRHRAGAGARRREGPARRSDARRRAARAHRARRRDARRRRERSATCGLVIEAIVEDLDVKRALFAALEEVVARRVRSSRRTRRRSPSPRSARRATHAGRVVGHALLQSRAGDAARGDRAGDHHGARGRRSARARSSTAWGKTTVVATDTPGFIVNRVARPFYGEALRMLEEGHRRRRHDRLGDARARRIPHGTVRADGLHRQRRELRRHAQRVRGVLLRSALPSVAHAAAAGRGGSARSEARARLLRLPRRRVGARAGRAMPTLGSAIVDRILAMLVNEAVDAVHLRVAAPHDIELAMTKGVNYPRACSRGATRSDRRSSSTRSRRCRPSTARTAIGRARCFGLGFATGAHC